MYINAFLILLKEKQNEHRYLMKIHSKIQTSLKNYIASYNLLLTHQCIIINLYILIAENTMIYKFAYQ